MHVVYDEKHGLHSCVTKHFDQAGDEGQALVSDGLNPMHFLSFIGDEESRISPMLPLMVVLNQQIAAYRRDQWYKALLDQRLHV